MKYLIISDIHGNLEALEAVLDHATRIGYDKAVCAGDHVGYGANPNECVERIAELPGLKAVLGNHDAATVDRGERHFFNAAARAGIIYSETHLNQKSREYLEALPLVVRPGSDFLTVHASPHNPDVWGYVLDGDEAADAFRIMDCSLAFIGHSHYPVIFAENGTVNSFVPENSFKLPKERKIIINVGSVGQPRDGDPRAAFVIFDDEEHVAEIHRVEYDIDKAAEKILRASLPPILAERIRHGI